MKIQTNIFFGYADGTYPVMKIAIYSKNQLVPFYCAHQFRITFVKNVYQFFNNFPVLYIGFSYKIIDFHTLFFIIKVNLSDAYDSVMSGEFKIFGRTICRFLEIICHCNAHQKVPDHRRNTDIHKISCVQKVFYFQKSK